MDNNLFASHKQLAFPDNRVMVNPVSEDKFTPAIPKLVELAKVTGGRIKDLVMAPFESAVKIGEAINDSSKRQKYFENPAELTNDMLNVAAPSSIGNKSYGLGAINLEGFFSPLTRAFEERKIGKSLLSPKMSGNQMLATLKSGGIKDDELKFTGVGKILGTDIGEKQVGKKVVGLKNVAEKKALEFSREDRPGDYHTYSLFPDGDESFKTALYKLPNTGFNESHFGNDVIAHRRYGNKNITFPARISEQDSKRLLELESIKNDTSIDAGTRYKAFLGREDILKKSIPTSIDSLHLDEVQSQFYEKGSKFGHGGPKEAKPTQQDYDDYIRAYTNHQIINNPQYSEALKNESYKDLSTIRSDIANSGKRKFEIEDEIDKLNIYTPQGFSNKMRLDHENSTINNRYFENDSRFNSFVADAPLKNEKYVELLAKDHLRDALKEGKDAVSWTPSNVQHERYYGKDALGGFTWKFDDAASHRKSFLIGELNANNMPPDYFSSFDDMVKFANGEYKNRLTGDLVKDQKITEFASNIIDDMKNIPSEHKSSISITMPHMLGERKFTTVTDMHKELGFAATKKLLEDMQYGITSGTLEGNAKDIYQKLYDRAIPKAFEKLTGEKVRKGFVKDRNGNNVEIHYVPVNKEKFTTPAKEQELWDGEIEDYRQSVNIKKNDLKHITDVHKHALDKYTKEYYSYVDSRRDKGYDLYNNPVVNVINKFTQDDKLNWKDLRKFVNTNKSLDEEELNILRLKLSEVRNFEDIEHFKREYEKDASRLKDLTPHVKDLPIANADQVVKDFFNV